MKRLALLLLFAFPVAAQPKILVSNPRLRNVGIGRSIQWSLSLIPNSSRLEWTIIVEPHASFQAAWRARTHSKNQYPQRCWTLPAKRETHCDADWAMEFSGMAKAGTLAHEYGHILCGADERAADYCGSLLMQGKPIAAIRAHGPIPGF